MYLSFLISLAISDIVEFDNENDGHNGPQRLALARYEDSFLVAGGYSNGFVKEIYK